MEYKYFNDMFQNCKSLTNLPNLSNWKFKEDSDTDSMFEGCELLEINLNYEKYSYENSILFLCLKYISKNIVCCCSNFWTNCCKLWIIFYILLIIIYLISPFLPLYYSFHLEKIKTCAQKPKEVFDLINNTNITHISLIFNITNSSLIKEMSEKKDEVIDDLLNAIIIKGNISFESDENYFKVYSVIITIIYIFKILIYIILIIGFLYNFINLIKEIILSSIIIVLNIALIIFEILDYFIIKRFKYSISIFYSNLEAIFQIGIPQENYNEIKYLEYSSWAIVVNFLVSVVSIILIIFICNESIKQGRQPYTYKDFLIKKIL